MSTAVTDILRAFHRARAASTSRGLSVLVDGARKLVPRAARAGCVLLERAAEPRERHGDAAVLKKADRIRAIAEYAVMEGTPAVILASARNDDLIRGLGVSSLAWIPLSGQLPTGLQSESAVVQIPVAALAIETDPDTPPLEPTELREVTLLAELVGEVLFHAHDARAGIDDRLTPQGFRRMLEHWIALARIRRTPLSLALVALEGLSEVNQRFGFDAGDQTLEGAFAGLVARLPPNAIAAHHGGAALAILFLRQGEEEAHQSVLSLTEVAGEPWFRAHDVPLRLTGAVVSLSSLPESRSTSRDLIDAAEAALHHARATRRSVVAWNESIAFDAASHPFSDLAEIDGAEYQRLLAVWRLLDALSRSAGFNEIVSETLRALVRPFRAERASLWKATDDGWSPLVTLGRATTGAIPHSDDDRALVSRITDKSDVATDMDGQGTRAIAIACHEGTKVTAVLCLTGMGHPLDLGPNDIAFLRALCRQIGRAFRDVAALEDARRERVRVEQRLQKQSMELRRLLRNRTGLLGTHDQIRRAMATIERAARSTVPVLLTGETGTGKGAAARLIHQLSNRPGPWVVVDCGAIPGQLLDSELFGHERGAFTGAETRKIGRFEEAHGGTIFLDEIGELPIELQPKLLRVLQESTVRRIGGTSDMEIDFRLIAATNRDLRAMVEAGRFREDLYFRIGVVEISIPPLRERGEDAVLLSLYFLREYCAEVGRDLMSISSEAQEALLRHSWPGNVRELQNRVRRAVVMATGPEITPVDLELASPPRESRKRFDAKAEARAEPKAPLRSSSIPRAVRAIDQAPVRAPTPALGIHLPETAALNLQEALADWFWHAWLPVGDPTPHEAVEAFLIRSALQHTNGSRRAAAEVLGMHVETLSAHLQKLSDPALSRSLRGHPVAQALSAEVAGACAEPGTTDLMDRVLAIILGELLVYCRGNKTEMARLMGCGRRTLLNHLARHQILSPGKKTGQDAEER